MCISIGGLKFFTFSLRSLPFPAPRFASHASFQPARNRQFIANICLAKNNKKYCNIRLYCGPQARFLIELNFPAQLHFRYKVNQMEFKTG